MLPPSGTPRTTPSKNKKRRRSKVGDNLADEPENIVLPTNKRGKKDLEPGDIEPPKHNRLTRSSHTIRAKISNLNAKKNTLNLVSSSDDEDLGDDDGLGIGFSVEEVTGMFGGDMGASDFQDAIVAIHIEETFIFPNRFSH